jgi:gluconate 2-dehydrogenase alpha chain
VFGNVRHLLLSGIGKPYDPAANRGVVGRNYAYQCVSGVTAFFEDKTFNSFMGAGGMGRACDDFNGDNFDHSGHGFIGGGYIGCSTTGARPIESHPTPPGTPPWGSGWKKAVARYYDRSIGVFAHGAVQSYRGNHLDIDPEYRDAYGLPLLRLTFDFGANERKMSDFLTDQCEKVARASGADKISVGRLSGRYSIVPYQTTHNTGGAVMGADPSTSVVNKYLQCWDVPNVFAVGASAFPQNAGYNPTGTVGALTIWAADAIIKRYLKRPGELL